MFSDKHFEPPSAVTILRVGFLAALLHAGTVIAASEALTEAPLTARSTPRGATMFTELSPADTGVLTTNHFADPAMWGKLYQEFSIGAVGTGVAVGDYDNDGRPDLFIVSKTESSRLFRNIGAWKFADVTASASVEDVGDAAAVWKQGATFADVNNDGWLDLYVCRFAAANLLYINQGDGTFKEEAAGRGLAMVDASGMGAFADFDRDGWLDVYVQTNMLDYTARPNGQRDRLFRNNGDGTFTDVSDAAGIRGEAHGHSVTWWDHDADGWPDLYVANDFGPADSLYRNNRDGTFTDIAHQVLPHMPYASMGADLGDVNNDGLIDFLATEMATTSHEKNQRTKVDSRAGRPETTGGPDAAPQYERNALYLGTGTGFFQEAALMAGVAATDWTWSVRFEDLDNDGRLDLHVTNGMVRELHNRDILARMNASESLTTRVQIMRATPVFAETQLAYRNIGDVAFEEVGAAWGLGGRRVSFGAAFGDFDGDGDLDLVFSNYEADATVLRNDSPTGHRAIFALRGTRSNRFGIGAKVRIETASGVQVRELALARGYLSSSEPVLHFGLSEDTIIKRLTVSWPSGHEQVFTDLPVDRRFILTESATARDDTREPAPVAAHGQFAEVSRAAGLSLASREEELDETARQPLLPMRQNRRGPAVAIGDLNGDGHDDVAVGGTTLDPTRVLLGSGSGTFQPSREFTPRAISRTNEGPLVIFDADGDGRNDLLVTKGGVNRPAGHPHYEPQLFLNRGAALEAAPTGLLPSLPMRVGAAAVADFNRDGRLDVFLGGRSVPGRYPFPPRSALLVNEGGKFTDATDTLASDLVEAGMVTSALWTDVDDDGWLDLLIALEWGGVRYWHNHQGTGFEDRSDAAGFGAAGTGWWTSLAAADFNADGRLDYAVGNVGLNTPYRATPEQPALLFHGKFEERASPQLIEAYHEGDRLYPRRGSQQLGLAAPSLLRRYPRTDDYARATLSELLGEEPLAAAERWAATELRSGVFLSQADGTFRFSPLPRIAQVAPVQGMVAGDFDGDGHADLYAVQNSHAPIPLVGRFAGGVSQLLRGDGRGGFTSVPPRESNLIVPGDAKALAVMDLDGNGWPDFFLTRNHSSSLAYLNQGTATGRPLIVRLRGTVGNSTAVGARVTLEAATGAVQRMEIHAGSGHSSQSIAAAFFGHVKDNPAQRVRVRWPDGAVSEHDVPAEATTVTLTQPAP